MFFFQNIDEWIFILILYTYYYSPCFTKIKRGIRDLYLFFHINVAKKDFKFDRFRRFSRGGAVLGLYVGVMEMLRYGGMGMGRDVGRMDLEKIRYTLRFQNFTVSSIGLNRFQNIGTANIGFDG